MSRFASLLFELLLITISIVIADALQSQINFIPNSIIHLPNVDYPRSDFYTVLIYFLTIHAIVFSLVYFRLGVWQLTNAKRTVDQIFALITAYTLSTLIVFVTTSVAYDPNFIAGIALISGTLYVVAFFVAVFLDKQSSAFLDLLKALGARVTSLVGIMVLVFAISPAILAKLFTSDRDVANVITQIRIYFNKDDDLNYMLVNVFGQLKFAQPMLIKQAPHEKNRLYVLERSGRLLSISYPEGDDLKVELDINNKVGEIEVENGALGFAFHPKFNQSGLSLNYVYIYYTEVNQEGEQINRLSRFDLAANDQDRADTEVPLLVLPRTISGFHNGGSVEFDNTGYLYLALGEGVHPKGVINSKETLRSGILRIDTDCKPGSLPISGVLSKGIRENYCIPGDNPFVGNEQVLPEYWALGLRNPYRMDFSQNGDLWVGDVGSTKWEEVNKVVKGGNYQFPYVEGYEATGIKNPDKMIGIEYAPIYTYLHTAYDRAVIGGFVYQGNEFPELQGQYIFSDNYSSKVFEMRSDLDRVENVSTIARANQFAQRGVSSIVQLRNGDVLLTTLGRSVVASGEVLKLVDKGDAKLKQKEDIKQDIILHEEAKTIYAANCARCHGASGKGDGPDVEALGVTIADFRSKTFMSTRSEKHIYDAIEKGGIGVGLSPMMPPWEQILNESEIKALVEVIKTMSK